VNEFDVPGMQVDGTIFIRAVEAILHIAFDRASHGRQLYADLVMPAGMRPYFEKKITIPGSGQAVVQPGAR
jgi:hypothetical protein